MPGLSLEVLISWSFTSPASDVGFMMYFSRDMTDNRYQIPQLTLGPEFIGTSCFTSLMLKLIELLGDEVDSKHQMPDLSLRS